MSEEALHIAISELNWRLSGRVDAGGGIKALTRWIELLERDSKRLSWLHENHVTALACFTPRIWTVCGMGKENGVDVNLRKAIDAAMKASEA